MKPPGTGSRAAFSPKSAGLLVIGIVVVAVIAELAFVAILSGDRAHGFLRAILLCVLATIALAACLWFVIVAPVQRTAERVGEWLRQSRDQFRSLYKYNADAIATYDLEGCVVSGNLAAMRLIGADAEALLGKHFSSHIAPDAVPEAERRFIEVKAGNAVEFDTIFLATDGRRINVHATLSPIIVEGKVTGVHGIARDMTEQRRLERQTARQAVRIRQLYLVAASAGKTADEQIIDTLRFGTQSLGMSCGFVTQIWGGLMTIIYAEGGGEKYRTGTQMPLEQTLSRLSFGVKNALAVEDTTVEAWASDPAGVAHDWRSYIGAGVDIGGVPYGTLAFLDEKPRAEPWTETDKDFVQLMGALVASAIERGLQYHKLDRMAFYDHLTDLPNRLMLNDRLAEALAVAKRYDHSVAVHYLDLDEFKNVNDTFGHTAGDAVLLEATARLRAAMRETDTISRVGGDEFVVLQTFVQTLDDAKTLGDRLLHAMRSPFDLDGTKVRMGLSVGIALYPKDASDAPTLLRNADAALYDAKRKGKNQMSFYHSELTADVFSSKRIKAS